MAEPIYQLYLARPTEASYQLSDEEKAEHVAKIKEAYEEVGGKKVLNCRTRWCNEEWSDFGISVFPSIEAVQRFSELLDEIDHPRYFEAMTLLGTRT